MPRRSEGTSSPASAAPRRSPRAAVKASASPGPVVRGSRSRSTAQQTTPKTRVASPSPKRRGASKNTKTEKDESPKQSRAPATKKAAAKKTPTTSKSRSRGRQKKNVEEESEEEEEEVVEEEEEEPKPSAHRSRSRTTKAAAKAPPAKKGRATSARKGKGKAQAKEESEEGEDEEEDEEVLPPTKAEKKKPPPKPEPEQADVGGGGRTKSRGRRATSRQSEETAAAEDVKEVAAKPMRSRSRGQVIKAEEEEPAAEGIASEAKTAGQTEEEERQSKRGQKQSEELREPKGTVVGTDDIKDDTPKASKRANADVEKSPESTISSKRPRKDEVSESASPIKNQKESPTKKPIGVAPDSEAKTKEALSKKECQPSVVKETPKVQDVGMSEAKKPRTETEMAIDRREEKNTERIPPKGSSPMKPASQSSKDTSQTSRKTDELKSGALDTSKSPIKSSDSIDLTKSSVKTTSESIQLGPIISHSIDLSKRLPSSTGLPESPLKSSGHMESSMKVQSGTNLPKSPVKSLSGLDLSKGPVKGSAEFLRSPVKPQAVIDVTKGPVRPPVVIEASKSPARPPVVIDASKSPMKSPVAMDISESPVRSTVSMDAWKSSVKSPMATDTLRSPMKSPHTMDVSKSPVDLTKSTKPVSEIVKGRVSTVLSTTSSPAKVPTVTAIPHAMPTSTIKPVLADSPSQKDKPLSALQTNYPMSGSKPPNPQVPISPYSGMSSVASANSPVRQPVSSQPVKSFTPQPAAGMFPVTQVPSSKPTVVHPPVSSPKSPVPPQSRSPVISGMGLLPSKPSYQPGGMMSPSGSQFQTQQLSVQSATPKPDITSSPMRQPVVQSSNQSLPQRSVAPSSTLSLTRQPVVQATNLVSAQQPVESSANPAKIQSPTVHGTHPSQTKPPVVQSATLSQSYTVQGTGLGSLQSPVKSAAAPMPLGKSTMVDLTGPTPQAKVGSPLSPRILQNKPDAPSSGCLNLSSESGSQHSRPSLAPTWQVPPMKTSITQVPGSPQSKPPIPLIKSGYSDKPTPTSPPKPVLPVSSTYANKPIVMDDPGSKPAAVSILSGSPTRPLVQPSSVPIGRSVTPSPVTMKLQETKITSSQSVTIKPQVTHVAGGAPGRPLITHMTGVVPPKAPAPQSAVTVPIKTSSLPSNKPQLAAGFSTSSPKPSVGQGYSVQGGPMVPRPSMVQGTGNVSPKPQPQHESSGVPSRPPQTWGTMSSPPKPQVTHLAGVAPVAHSRPQVTHMSGVAPPKSQVGPGDGSLHPKPPVVHVTGSAVPKSTGLSPSVAASPQQPPPKTSLHSSASYHSATQAPSTNDGSSFSSLSQTKSPSVPVTAAGKPVSPSHAGAQSVTSQQRFSSGTTSMSGQAHATQPDSSFGRLLSSTVPQQVTSSNVQYGQSLHSQKSNVPPTMSHGMPGTMTKSMQPSSTAGHLADSKAHPSSCIVSKAPDSSMSSSTPSTQSLFTTTSRMDSQSKVPSLSRQSPQTTIPVISSTTTSSDRPVSSNTTSGSAHVPIRPQVTGQTQSSQPQNQSGRPLHVPPTTVTIGNVQQVGGTMPFLGAALKFGDSLKASSSSSDVINGAGAKTSAGLLSQSSDASKKRKWDSEPTAESLEAKKSRLSPEDVKSLIANGQKDSSSIYQAPKLQPNQPSNNPQKMDVDQSPSVKQDSNGSDVSLKDYVVVDKNQVPHKDSLEVRNSLPKMPPTKMPLSTPAPTQYTSVGGSRTPGIAGGASIGSSSPASGPAGLSSSSTGSRDVLLNRPFKLNPALPSSMVTEKSRQFSVVTYNILADCHFKRGDKPDKYPADEKPFIQLSARHKRLMAELRYVDADIVCLQEVEPEYYSKTLSPDMQRLGYEGFYKKRVHENYDEGETTFYKTSRFSDPENTAYSLKQLIDKDIQELSLSEDIKECVRKFMCRPDVLLVTRLRCKNTGKFITVGNVHINWGEFKLTNLQCVQIARAIREVVNRAGNDTSPHVICGDFNSHPRTPGYQLASEGYLSDIMIQSLQSSKTMEMPDGTRGALVDHLWQGFQHTSSSLKSAYCVVQGQEPELTSMTQHTRECLDYVFYSSSSLEAVGVLKVPEKKIVLDCIRIPNRIFPSDHLSLKAVLAFK